MLTPTHDPPSDLSKTELHRLADALLRPEPWAVVRGGAPIWKPSKSRGSSRALELPGSIVFGGD